MVVMQVRMDAAGRRWAVSMRTVRVGAGAVEACHQVAQEVVLVLQVGEIVVEWIDDTFLTLVH